MTCKHPWELAKIDFINSANLEQRKAISESDKKYRPQFEEREKAENERMTGEEKKIRGLTKTWMKLLNLDETEARKRAENIIFGAKK